MKTKKVTYGGVILPVRFRVTYDVKIVIMSR